MRKYHLQTQITTSLRFATGGLQLDCYCILTLNLVLPRKLSPTSLEFATGHVWSYKTCFSHSLSKAIPHVPGVCNWALTELQNVLFGLPFESYPPRPWSLQLGTYGATKRAFRTPFRKLFPTSLEFATGTYGATKRAFWVRLRNLSPTPLKFASGHGGATKHTFWTPLRKLSPKFLEFATRHFRS